MCPSRAALLIPSIFVFAVPAAGAQERAVADSSLARALLQAVEDVAPPHSGPRFIDLDELSQLLSSLSPHGIDRSGLDEVLPRGYRHAPPDTVRVCPDQRLVTCRIRNGGVLVTIDSVWATSKGVRAWATWRTNAQRLERGTHATQWEIELAPGERGTWRVVHSAVRRMSD